MRKNNLLDSMEMLDPSIIEEADLNIKPAKRITNWIRVVAIAASLLVVAGIGFVMGNLMNNKDNPVESIAATEGIEGTDMPTTDINGNPEGTQLPIEEGGLYIPAIELPDNTSGVEIDMIGLVVYQGGIYTQSASYTGADAVEINNNLLGNYLGYATGSISEWSTQDEYAEEFASSVAGEIYEVIGYDSSFRICMKWEGELDNGETVLNIQFLDRLNGITLNTGSDLFEDRLHLNNRIVSIECQSHDDWNYAVNNYRTVDVDDATWGEFINQLYSGNFVNTWDPDNYTDTIYDTENQAHIYLRMNDGTTIGLTLIEGGYVGYDALGWYFVQIPGEAFDSVFEACGGN